MLSTINKVGNRAAAILILALTLAVVFSGCGGPSNAPTIYFTNIGQEGKVSAWILNGSSSKHHAPEVLRLMIWDADGPREVDLRVSQDDSKMGWGTTVYFDLPQGSKRAWAVFLVRSGGDLYELTEAFSVEDSAQGKEEWKAGSRSAVRLAPWETPDGSKAVPSAK